MSKVLTIVLCIALCICAVAATAQEGMKGRVEATGAFAYVNVSDLDLMVLAATYGKFVTPQVEAGLGVIWADLDGDSIWGLAPQLAYHFVPEEPSKTVPFVAASYLYLDTPGDNYDTWSVSGGMKFFLDGDYTDANQAITAEVRYVNDVMGEDVLAVMAGSGRTHVVDSHLGPHKDRLQE